MDIKNIDVNKLLNLNIPLGKDPDRFSKELKEYHICLCSSRTINEKEFILNSGKNNKMIYSNGNIEIIFTPDSITNVFQNSSRRYNGIKEKDIINKYSENEEIKELIEEYRRIDYTIGSSIIFPISINNQSLGTTINRARGVLYQIHDRIDFTLKCIKLYYEDSNDINPLLPYIQKNKAFFDLFGSFKAYVDFFFLNDLVDKDYNVIYLDNECSFSNPFPYNIDVFKEYISNTIKFINNRNKRIAEWVKNWK